MIAPDDGPCGDRWPPETRRGGVDGTCGDDEDEDEMGCDADGTRWERESARCRLDVELLLGEVGKLVLFVPPPPGDAEPRVRGGFG